MQTELNIEHLSHTVASLAQGNQRRLPEALDQLPTPIYVTDAEGWLTYYNWACIPFSGRTPRVGEDRWCVTWELYTSDGRRLPHDQCPMATAIHERRAVRGAAAIALRPDGTRVRFQPSPTPLFDDRGGFIGAINILVDLDAQKPSRLLSIEAARYRRLANSLVDEKATEKLAALATACELAAIESPWCCKPEDRWEPKCSNEILATVASDYSAFLGLFVPVQIKAGDVLVSPDRHVEYVYFLESGLASIVTGDGHKRSEVAMVGREGMIGHCVLLGADRSPQTTLMRVGGTAFRIGADVLRYQMDLIPQLCRRLLMFVHALGGQMAETSCAAAVGNVETRLAKWLVMATERIGSNVYLTHDSIADVLGTRRASVTMAMHVLEGKKAIRSTRSKITVIDSARLQMLASTGTSPKAYVLSAKA
ncbi:MAG: hypothetical protein JWM36_4827 [Hyphomicrobiales bacterium]|nr:hypothetical protein [Hyphomicrobiales bacterium]